MKYTDVLTGEDIKKKEKLFAEVSLNESSIGDDVVVVKPFQLTNAKQVVLKDEEMIKELKAVKEELDKVKLERRELKKEVKSLKEAEKELIKELNKTVTTPTSVTGENDD